MTVCTTSYTSSLKKQPRFVCFTTTSKNTKRFVRYGMATGSHRVQRQLDMPLSAKVYDETLRDIAYERYQKLPIRAEINVVDADQPITEADIATALSNGNADSVQFWENNMSLFGAYDDLMLTSARRMVEYVNGMESFKQLICNHDVLREKHWFLRNSKEGKIEQLFAVACRFALDGPNNSMFIYATHIESTKTVKLEERNRIWSMLSEKLISRPQQFVGVPDDIHFKTLCEMEGWTA